MDNKQKAKRKLKGFDFSKDGAAVALVGPSVGGPANGIPTLIAKANNFSPEFIKKMQQIQVTMELPDFLEKFFGVWGTDAEVLARLMGYVKPEDDSTENMDWDDWYEKCIEEKLSSFTILKSLHESENLPEALSKLTEQDYLDVLNDQVVIEKAMKELAEQAKTSTKDVEKQVEAQTSKVTKKKGKQMTQQTEMVEKSELVAIQKSFEDQKVELQKALDQVAKYEEAAKQAIIKSKTDAVKAVIKDEKHAEVVVKAVLALETQEDVDALVGVFKAMNEQIEKSALFQEQGGSGASVEDKAQESGVARILKQRNQAKK